MFACYSRAECRSVIILRKCQHRRDEGIERRRFFVILLFSRRMTSNLCATAVLSDSNRPNATLHARLSNPLEKETEQRERVHSPVTKESAFEG